jgi:hypothetical protein
VTRPPPSPTHGRNVFSTSSGAVVTLALASTPPLGYSSPPLPSGRPDFETIEFTPAGQSPIRASFPGDPPLSRPRRTDSSERGVIPRIATRDRLPCDDRGHVGSLDEGPDSVGPSAGMPSYSGDSDRGEIIATAAEPALQPFWGFEDVPNSPTASGRLSSQDACLVRCFIKTLATTVSCQLLAAIPALGAKLLSRSSIPRIGPTISPHISLCEL